MISYPSKQRVEHWDIARESLWGLIHSGLDQEYNILAIYAIHNKNGATEKDK